MRAATGWRDPDTVSVTFLHTPAPAPPGPEAGDGPGLVFEWRLPDDGRPAEAQAAAAVERLESTDPTTYATPTGGDRELAESLGYAWPRRNQSSRIWRRRPGSYVLPRTELWQPLRPHTAVGNAKAADRP